MANTTKECRAKVFVSCGQAHPEERHAATAIEEKLRSMHFDVYVAKEVQNMGGVEELMRQLKSSEYFLFVDFYRPATCPSLSLFSHQELAVAYDRGIEAKFLQEEKAEQRGIARYLFTNPHVFKSRDELPALVGSLCEDWNPNWKNALTAEETTSDEDVEGWYSFGRTLRLCRAKYFHILVKNEHERRMARRCVVFLKNVLRVGDGKVVERECPIEHKWAGYRFPEALIRPGACRPFDAFFIITEVLDESQSNAASSESPSLAGGYNSTASGSVCSIGRTLSTGQAEGQAFFNTLTDFSGYQQPLPRGRYKFTYEVLAEDFPTTEAVFDVHIGDGVGDTSIKFVERSYHYT